MSLVHFNENMDIQKFHFDPPTLAGTSYDMIFTAMEQNDEFRKGHWLGRFMFEKFNHDIEEHDTLQRVSDFNTNRKDVDKLDKTADATIASIQAANKAKHLVLLSTHDYTRSLMSKTPENLEKRKKSLAELKTLLTPFFTEHLKQPETPAPPKKRCILSLFKN